MNGARMLYFLAQDRQKQPWEEADAWRRFHSRPDALPLPEEPDARALGERIVSSIPVVRRLRARAL